MPERVKEEAPQITEASLRVRWETNAIRRAVALLTFHNQGGNMGALWGLRCFLLRPHCCPVDGIAPIVLG